MKPKDRKKFKVIRRVLGPSDRFVPTGPLILVYADKNGEMVQRKITKKSRLRQPVKRILESFGSQY